MGIQLAVSPTALVPGLYLVANLLAGASNPGTQPLKAVELAPKSSAGTLTADTEVRLIGSADDAKTAWGTKTPGYLAAVQFFAENPTGILYGVAPTASGGASATASFTFAATPTAARTVRVTAAGRVTEFAWLVSETADALKTRAIAFINGRDDIPVTASSGGVGVLTLTFPVAGPWGNDVVVYIELIDGAGGTVGGAQSASASLAGGTTEPDFTTALATISGTQYDYIGIAVSNADAQSASATSNPGRLKTHINSLNTGLNAKLQQGVVGITGALATAKTGAIGRNEQVMEYMFCMAGQSLPAEFGGAEMGARMRAVSLDPAANRIGTVLAGVVGARDLTADTPTTSEAEDALGNGLSIATYNASGQVVVMRPVTTHSQDSSGNPDRRCLDTSGPDGVYAVGNDIKTFLPAEFFQVKIAKDQAAGEEPLPDGVVEERDIKASLIARLRFWQRRGVVRRDKLDEAIAAGTLIVRVNASDETQVDIVIPLGIFKPLAKMGVVLNKAA
jgi:phage tail sheath gpL-like